MKLKKELRLLHVFSICTGAMLSGLFILPGLGYSQAGPALILCYCVAGILAAAGMLSQAELASAMPKAGGTYFYVMRSMGPAVGAVYGLITWVSLALKCSYELFFIASFAVISFQLPLHLTAIIICAFFLLLNIVGIREAGRVQIVLVISLFTALGFYIISGLPHANLQYFQPFIPAGQLSILSTSGFIFISYGGLLKIASLGEEVKEPGRILPLGMIFSLIMITLIYIAVIFVIIGNLPGNVLSASLSPVSDSAMLFIGPKGRLIFIVAAIIALISSINTGVMSASRYPLALARDEMLPSFLTTINHRFKTPASAIIVTGIIIIISLFLPLNTLVKAASSVLILTYIFTCLAVIILRESRLQNYQPSFRSPLYPWVQVFGISGFLLLLFGIGKEALMASILLITGGFIIYWFFGRVRSDREYALLHCIERITSRALTHHSLEEELKEIIRERDDILKDRFDHLIEQSIVLDIDHSLHVDDFFRSAADLLSERLGIPADTLFALFQEREWESTTVLTPYLAIPHIVIEGKGAFDLLLARCREGIYFSEEAPHVHAVFLLVGTRDERPFHLRSLAAVAQIVQDTAFDKKWLTARTKETLRDIVLLGKRKR